MKSILYTLAFSLVIISCKKTEVPVEDSEIVIWEYDVATTSIQWGVDTNYAYATNLAYPYSEIWTVEANYFATSYSPSSETNFYLEDGLGAFDFGFIEVHTNGERDTVYGSGYFDQDTIYLNYHYQNIEDPSVYGDVNIHSF